MIDEPVGKIIVLRNQRLTQANTRYDIKISLRNDEKGSLVRVYRAGTLVAQSKISLWEECRGFQFVRTADDRHTFFVADFPIHFGWTGIWHVSPTTLHFKEVLCTGHGLRTGRLDRGEVREVIMAKYLFGLDKLPKGDEGGTPYERVWRFDAHAIGFRAASTWHRTG